MRRSVASRAVLFGLIAFAPSSWADGAARSPEPAPPEPRYYAGYDVVPVTPPPSPYVSAQSLEGYRWESPPVMHFTDRPWAIELMTGFGTPVGLLGGVVEYSITDAVAVGGGIGVGIAGLEGGGILNFRPLHWERPRAAHALSIGVEYSMGAWTDFWGSIDQSSSDPHYASALAEWGQFDVGYELRARSGFSFRVAMGAAWMLNPGNVGCQSSGSESCTLAPYTEQRNHDAPIYTLTLAFGQALER